MKAEEEKKSLNADPDEVEGPETDLVKDMQNDYVSPPAASGRMNQPAQSFSGTSGASTAGGSLYRSLFTSVSLSKGHDSPCAVKPQAKDKSKDWEGGTTSDETPVEEDGQYLPPSMKMVKEDGEDKVVKKSFVSVHLSKAAASSVGATSVPMAGPPKPTVAPPKSKKDTDPVPKRYDTHTTRPYDFGKTKKLFPAGQLKTVSPEGRWAKHDVSTDEGMEELAHTKGVSKDKLTPKVRETVRRVSGLPPQGVKKSLTELRYGSQLTRNHDIGKSCGVCGRISKSCGDHEGGGCCGDCKKSMSTTSWHKSHLA